jgi:hypothetical protein
MFLAPPVGACLQAKLLAPPVGACLQAKLWLLARARLQALLCEATVGACSQAMLLALVGGCLQAMLWLLWEPAGRRCFGSCGRLLAGDGSCPRGSPNRPGSVRFFVHQTLGGLKVAGLSLTPQPSALSPMFGESLRHRLAQRRPPTSSSAFRRIRRRTFPWVHVRKIRHGRQPIRATRQPVAFRRSAS